MAKGISLHVGVNTVTPTLIGCVNDARSMRDIAKSQGFKAELLTDGQATIGVVTKKIQKAAAELEGGGFFLFTFAGHGSYLGDEDGDEPDSRDETVVLSDFMLSDDVIARDLWPCFKPGVRVLMVADSCHSGSVLRLIARDAARDAARTAGPYGKRAADGERVLRELPQDLRLQHIAENRAFYERLLNDPPACGVTTINASIMLLAACKDPEKTPDGDPDDPVPHGAFTEALLRVWNEGGFDGTYDDFLTGIKTELAGMGLTQTPLITLDGQGPTFRGQCPFTID